MELIRMLFVCGFWNGIVSVLVYQAVQSFARGRPESFLTLFIIPLEIELERIEPPKKCKGMITVG